MRESVDNFEDFKREFILAFILESYKETTFLRLLYDNPTILQFYGDSPKIVEDVGSKICDELLTQHGIKKILKTIESNQPSYFYIGKGETYTPDFGEDLLLAYFTEHKSHVSSTDILKLVMRTEILEQYKTTDIIFLRALPILLILLPLSALVVAGFGVYMTQSPGNFVNQISSISENPMTKSLCF